MIGAEFGEEIGEDGEEEVPDTVEINGKTFVKVKIDYQGSYLKETFLMDEDNNLFN